MLFVCLLADKIGLACYMPAPVPGSLTQTGLQATPTKGFFQPNGHSWGQLALKSEFLSVYMREPWREPCPKNFTVSELYGTFAHSATRAGLPENVI